MTSCTALAAQLSIWNNQFVHFFPITLRVDKKNLFLSFFILLSIFASVRVTVCFFAYVRLFL